MPPSPTTPETPQRVAEHLSTLNLRPETIDAQMTDLQRRCTNFRNSEQLTLVIMALRQKEEAARGNAVIHGRLEGLRRELEGRLTPPVISTDPSQSIRTALFNPETVTGIQNPAGGTDIRNRATQALVAVGTALGIVGLINYIKKSGGVGGFLRRTAVAALGVFGLSALISSRQRAVAQGTAERGRTLLQFASNETTFGTGASALNFYRQPNGGTQEIGLVSGGRRFRLLLPRLTAPTTGTSATPPTEENLSAAISNLSQSSTTPDTLSLDVGSGPQLALPGLIQFGDRPLRLDLDAAARQSLTAAMAAPAPADGRRTVAVPFRMNVRGLSAEQVRTLSGYSTSAPARQEGDTLILTMNLRLEEVATPAPTTPATTPDGGLNGQTIPNATARTATMTANRTENVTLIGAPAALDANMTGSISARGVTVTRPATGNTLQVQITAAAVPGLHTIMVGTQAVTFTVAAP